MNKRLRWALVVIAVAIGGSFLAYYRGGDSEKLAREMEAAYSIAVQQRKIL